VAEKALAQEAVVLFEVVLKPVAQKAVVIFEVVLKPVAQFKLFKDIT
jgi:hypothetical protein